MHGGVCIALAITLLPNVRVVTIRNYTEMLEIVAGASIRSLPTSSIALSNLLEVHISTSFTPDKTLKVCAVNARGLCKQV